MRLALFLLACCSLLSSALGAITLHVSPQGNDAWSGRLAAPNAPRTDGPLASLTGARNAIRRLPSRREPVTVLIADGRYPHLEPLLLEPQDSGTASAPISYRAAPGAKPVFSGGVAVTGWKEAPGGLWTAALPAGVRTEQLWVDGARASFARHRGGEALLVAKVDEEVTAPARSQPEFLQKKFNVTPSRQTVHLDPGLLAGLEQLTPAEVRAARIMVFHKWNASPRHVLALDAKAGTIAVAGGPMQEWSSWRAKGTTVWIENVRTGLHQPGTFTLGADGTLLYRPRPGESLARSTVVAAVADKLLLLQGAPGEGNYVEHLTFSGLTFEHSRWLLPARGIGAEDGLDDLQAAAHIDAAIMGDGVRRVTFERCEISRVSRNAMWFRRGCRDVTIERCSFVDLGAGAVRIGDYVAPRYAFETTGGFTVRNCRIAHGGRTFPAATGIVVMHGERNVIAHNDVHDFFYSGISVGWVWGYMPTSARDNIVEFNRVTKIGQGLLSDMAGIYFLGPGERNVCRNNVVMDVDCHAYGGWGVYADEGSTGVLYENNLVVRTRSGGFHQHYGRENIVRNNIFAYGKEQQVTRPRAEEHLSYTYERNIVIWDEGSLAGHHRRSAAEGGKVAFEWNLYHPTGLAVAPFAQELAERRTKGLDAKSIVADPLFVDAKRGDFRLRPESPAEKIGFVPFDPSLAGIRPE